MGLQRLLLILIAFILLVRAFRIPKSVATLRNFARKHRHPGSLAYGSCVSARLKSDESPDVHQWNKNDVQVDYTVLEPDDPRFVDMPIPSESGPLAEAYNKHMLWRRGLSTGERARWHNWAVYRRMNVEHQADYCLQDYISQNLLHELNDQAKEEQRDNNTLQAFVMSSMGVAMEAAQREEVREVMKSYYYAFNNQILGQVRELWQQDVDVECILPGHAKARGDRAVDTLYMNLFDSSTSMGWVNATISSVQAFGNVALVHTVEEIGERLLPQTSSVSYITKKPTPLPPGMTLPKVLATTVLRRCNSQWRIVCHHAVRMWSSPFTNDQLVITFSKEDARRRAARLNPPIVQAKPEAPIANPSDQASEKGVHGGAQTSKRQLKMQFIEGAENALKVKYNRPSVIGMQAMPDNNIETALLGTLQSADPHSDTNHQRERDMFQSKPTRTGEIIDTVAVSHDNKLNDDRTEDSTALRIDASAPLNKQFVQALRLLHKQGSITQDEKETLLADMLSSVKQDKDSMVETAYDILCGPDDAKNNNDDFDLGMHLAEFGDQCRAQLKMRDEDSELLG